MKRSFGARRTPANLSGSVYERLNACALVASAAGIATLASAQVAEAKIVYTQTNVKFGPNDTVHLDLNHDGINDFDLVANSSQNFARLITEPSPKNDVLGETLFRMPFASALHRGDSIGPQGYFLRKNFVLMAVVFNENTSTFVGPWAGRPGHRTLNNRYLGFKFKFKGQYHYGWARLTVTVAGYPTGMRATLTGYAYETIPNTAIVAGKTIGPDQPDRESSGTGASVMSPLDTPQPATLGALAMGATGLSIWRREEPV